jgi:hypothetical protein
MNRRSRVRVIKKRLQAGCSETLPSRVGRRVPIGWSATQTHYATARTKKTCKRRPFRERLMGFEPTTFCMASRTCSAKFPQNMPANRRFLGT